MAALLDGLTLAHVGHWALDLLYVLPVLVVVGWIGVRALLDRREATRAREQPDRARERPG